MVSPSGEQRLSFGPFEADLSSGKLYKLGRRIPIQNKPFRLLAMLLARPREVVTREEVRKELWPDGTFVDFEEGLDTALKKLRHALGDSAQNPNFIETLPRRGYRFIAPSFRFDLVDQSTPAKAETHATKTETEGAAEAFTLAKGVRWLGGRQRFWIGLAVAIAIVLGSILGWRLARQAKAAPANIESLAVLPLENLSGDPSQDYFAAGMTEELITALGQINSLRVILQQIYRDYSWQAMW